MHKNNQLKLLSGQQKQIWAQREFEITHDVTNVEPYVKVMPNIKTIKFFQTTKLTSAVFDVHARYILIGLTDFDTYNKLPVSRQMK